MKIRDLIEQLCELEKESKDAEVLIWDDTNATWYEISGVYPYRGQIEVSTGDLAKLPNVPLKELLNK